MATLAVYGDLRTHQFVNFDDDIYITDNPQVQDGLTLKGLSWAFTSLQGGNWHPLTWLSFMVDSQLFGLHPGGFLLTNLLFHIANALLLFLWLLRTTRAPGCSFLVAALFALHPLHVESVAWAAERKDVLSTFFWLFTMWAYVWYAERPRLGRYLLILVCFSLGLMAKPMLVTLPFVLLLLDYWPLDRWPQKSAGSAQNSLVPKLQPGVPLGRLIWEKAPLFALAVILSVATFYAQKEVGAMAGLAQLPLPNRLANAFVAYFTYMVKMLYPSGLAVLYPLSIKDALPPWQWLGASLTLALISLLVIRKTSRHPYLLVGWLWYLGTLVPVIGLVQVGNQTLADRYTYVPLIGLLIIVVYGMAELAARWRAPRFLVPVGAGVVLSALMICTWVQVSYWRDSISLYEHTLKVTTDNFIIHNNLGETLAAQGKKEQAGAHYNEALRINTNYADARNNLEALVAQGKLDQAAARYAEALRLHPNDAETLRLKRDLAEAHNDFGNALAAKKKLDEAVAQYAEALRLEPAIAGIHNNLGVTLGKQGKMDQAIAYYAEALRLNPNFAEAQNNLGMALAKQGKLDEAIARFQKAIQIKPDFSMAYSNLGLALTQQGNIDKAINIFQNALKINPNNTSAQKLLKYFKDAKASKLKNRTIF